MALNGQATGVLLPLYNVQSKKVRESSGRSYRETILIIWTIGVPITSSDFWQDETDCSDQLLRYIFRSATTEKLPLLEERIACLREAGQILYEVRITSQTHVSTGADET